MRRSFAWWRSTAHASAVPCCPGPPCGSRVFSFASVGSIPQDLKYRGEPSTLELGAANIVREFVSINPGTAAGGMVTRTGKGCLFMVNAHVGHDCRLGDHVIVSPGAALGGHVPVEDHAIIG